ncbi:hypothetical protein HBA55_29410 [Pseudomaricurvus alkylphenolicus]|uniref:hypothetical protein n=1 Tax=Pseudomaricurvus alkylphenolicus TaxID=1306991 RepID=UPI0014231D22|nr:hypothetical protein [Pseudomaricurvus alkylphenolicus]NIB43757.1 hypothetical protein [Pseudomaricurvus alkylphenolicus]
MSDEDVLMPKSLTAENGAKGFLSGEFFEEVNYPCPHCAADNEHHDEDTGCHECDGTAVINSKVYVSWNNIKAIYAKAVEMIGVEPELVIDNKR